MFGVMASDGQKKPVRKRKAPLEAVQKGSACRECRRRKVACSNNRPCDSCIRFKCEDRCMSVSSTKKVARKSQHLTAVSSLNQCLEVLRRLFPDQNIETLIHLPREELLRLMGDPSEYPSSVETDKTLELEEGEKSEGSEDSLMENWVKEYGWEEEFGDGNVADDVNSLDLSLRPKSSYLGVSSISTVLGAIFKLGKGVFESTLTNQNKKDLGNMGRGYNTTQHEKDITNEAPVLSFTFTEGLKLIDAYFEYVHPTVPMIIEEEFRQIYCSRQKKRSSWLALLYIVLAWGTIVSKDTSTTDDIVFYNASRQHLKTLGGGNIEYLQTLILMGGHYLHYRNMPNTAMALTGAAFKIACGLGLHREVPGKQGSQLTLAQKEQRRRLWYTLYTAEIAGLFSLGRPSMFGGEGITIEAPSNIDEHTGMAAVGQLTSVSTLLCDISLSKILEKIEAMNLRTASPHEEEVRELDRELVTWYKSSPHYVRDPSDVSLGLYMSLRSTKWMYMNARIVLYRTSLLRAALSKKKLHDLSPRSRDAVEKCRELAANAITSIIAEWRPHVMSCWSGVWYLFQAAMIPMVTLFSEDRHDPRIKAECEHLIDMSLATLEEMSKYRHTGTQSCNVVRVMYEASMKLPDDNNFTPADESSWEDILWGPADTVDMMQQTDFISLLLGGEQEYIYYKSETDTPETGK